MITANPRPPLALLALGGLLLTTNACVTDVGAPDDDTLASRDEIVALERTCEPEVYYFVVDARDEAAALGACKKVCAEVLCSDFETPATASIPGPAGDDDTFKCDCTCGCADDAEVEPL